MKYYSFLKFQMNSESLTPEHSPKATQNNTYEFSFFYTKKKRGLRQS